MAKEINWLQIAATAIIFLLIGTGAGFAFDNPATVTVEKDVIKEVAATNLNVDGVLYNVEGIKTLITDNAGLITERDDLKTTVESQEEMAEVHADYLKRFDIAKSCFVLFNAEWTDEFEWEDPVSNLTYDYDDLSDGNIDVEVEDTPDVDDGWKLLDATILTETDHKDDEWSVVYNIEIEVDGVDYLYLVSCAVEELEADKLTLTQL